MDVVDSRMGKRRGLDFIREQISTFDKISSSNSSAAPG